jgi:dTDP-4-amino-4,6-dideoxygalactose transaminase
MQVPLLDLKAQYETIREETRRVVNEVLESQYFINGQPVRQLEADIAAYSGCQAAVGMSSGTDALLCTLMALDIGGGDEVITTPYTFFATAGSIWRTGAKPVFVDIEPATFNLDVAQLEAAVTPRTKAIMPVHLFGQMADMEHIMAVARRHGLHVIEDACQAIGASQNGHKAGSVGTAGCFSFFPSKNLGGLGDGGMTVTQDADLAQKLTLLRNHGMHEHYHHKWVGGNFRLDTLQAAGILVKLPHLDNWSDARRANAARYNELLAGCAAVTTPTVKEGNLSIFNQYVIRVPRRDELKQHLAEKNIGTAIYYPVSLHEQECFASLGYRRGDFPQSERAAAEALALPIYPELTDAQLAYVAEQVKAFY